MNGYDFDKTILKGNSVRRFCMYCMARRPYLWIFLPVIVVAVLLRGLRILKKEPFLRMLECFIVCVPNREKMVQRFWDKNIKHVQSWYLQVRTPNDIIISASPAYLVQEACRRLGVNFICSSNNSKGVIVGKHCYGVHKVEAYKARFGDTPLETFYSDSLSDTPMFQLAKQGYLVKGNKITLLYQDGQKVSKQ